jgi:cytochrome oxidase Cu insertion factor (SCO1/SenC/PrrC family)
MLFVNSPEQPLVQSTRAKEENRTLTGKKEGGKDMSRIELNSKAPDFTLEDYQGNLIKLDDFRGKNILLVFNRGFA